MQETFNRRFTRLYRTYHQFVLNLCMKYVKQESIARDLTHDIFLKIHRSLDKFQKKSRYSTWIYRISVNYCLDHIRNTKRRNFLLEEPKNLFWDYEHLTESETYSRAIVQHEMNRFPKTTQEVLYMRYALGLNQSEIAKELSISRVAVTKRLQNYHRKRTKNIRKRSRNYKT